MDNSSFQSLLNKKVETIEEGSPLPVLLILLCAYDACSQMSALGTRLPVQSRRSGQTFVKAR